MQELHDLELLLRSRTPLVVVESLEETRVLQLFARLGLRLAQPMYRWTVTEGLKRLEADFAPQRTSTEPDEVLKQIKASERQGCYLLLDFHPYLSDPRHVRLIKEIALGYETTPRTLIFLSYAFDTPPEIRHLTARFELKLPDRATIKALIREEARRWSSDTRRQVKADPAAIEQLVDNLTGVTISDARRLIRRAIADDGAITRADLPTAILAKYELIGRDGILSFEYDTARFSEVAGLKHLKQWLEQRRKAFSGPSGPIDPPKGIMLLGVQGGGKSLAAKAVAGLFDIPLLRLDFGALYNKFYGETERNLRNALKMAERMAPCVLWMDEIEKGIAHSGSDEGLSQRVLGTLLTWMAERNGDVFVVATSNNIEHLPPELVRKGRLDEIFFVDLPDRETRRQIFEIHLRRRNQAPSRFDLDLLSDNSDGFTGAEIEQAIVSALYAAQAQESTLDSAHLLQELEQTRPLSVVMAEQVERLRAWADGRTVQA
jgi:SpoVK/Ycf46/Vps4 family AAA+-type ATPase